MNHDRYRYQRVLPRDLFNEAKLLKCLGEVCLLIHDGKLAMDVNDLDLDENGFVIHQDPEDGSIYCSNVGFYAKDTSHRIRFYSPMNSRKSYPLMYTATDSGENITVLNFDGGVSDEFVKELERIQRAWNSGDRGS